MSETTTRQWDTETGERRPSQLHPELERAFVQLTGRARYRLESVGNDLEDALGSSADRPVGDLVEEILDELGDVTGWSSTLVAKVNRIRDRLHPWLLDILSRAVKSADVNPHPEKDAVGKSLLERELVAHIREFKAGQDLAGFARAALASARVQDDEIANLGEFSLLRRYRQRERYLESILRTILDELEGNLDRLPAGDGPLEPGRRRASKEWRDQVAGAVKPNVDKLVRDLNALRDENAEPFNDPVFAKGGIVKPGTTLAGPFPPPAILPKKSFNDRAQRTQDIAEGLGFKSGLDALCSVPPGPRRAAMAVVLEILTPEEVARDVDPIAVAARVDDALPVSINDVPTFASRDADVEMFRGVFRRAAERLGNDENTRSRTADELLEQFRELSMRTPFQVAWERMGHERRIRRLCEDRDKARGEFKGDVRALSLRAEDIDGAVYVAVESALAWCSDEVLAAADEDPRFEGFDSVTVFGDLARKIRTGPPHFDKIVEGALKVEQAKTLADKALDKWSGESRTLKLDLDATSVLDFRKELEAMHDEIQRAFNLIAGRPLVVKSGATKAVADLKAGRFSQVGRDPTIDFEEVEFTGAGDLLCEKGDRIGIHFDRQPDELDVGAVVSFTTPRQRITGRLRDDRKSVDVVKVETFDETALEKAAGDVDRLEAELADVINERDRARREAGDESKRADAALETAFNMAAAIVENKLEELVTGPSPMIGRDGFTAGVLTDVAQSLRRGIEHAGLEGDPSSAESVRDRAIAEAHAMQHPIIASIGEAVAQFRSGAPRYGVHWLAQQILYQFPMGEDVPGLEEAPAPEPADPEPQPGEDAGAELGGRSDS